jgi:hypothetical protein
MAVTALDMFYETREPEAVHITNSDAANNPNTELTQTPTSAVIRYESGVVREVPEEHPEMEGKDRYKLSQFLISRAMLDPDAVVTPV